MGHDQSESQPCMYHCASLDSHRITLYDLLQQVPSGLLPAMELDGQLYTESDLIMQVLEERFPDKPMMPAKGDPQYQRAQRLLRLERQLFGVWLQWLCRSW